MKKAIAVLLVATLAAGIALAQELKFSGEAKTGVYWENIKEGDNEQDLGTLGNTDDAGYPGVGRIRLNAELVKDNIGLKVRWEDTTFNGTLAPKWSYAYGYGSFIRDQLKLSAGRLGDSPWGTGGYEINSALDDVAGLRTEIKPNVLSGLNVGFVLNTANRTQGVHEKTLKSLIEETIVGASYTHEFFEVRLAYRFDTENDWNNNQNEGTDLTYRVEERVLRNLVKGLAIWANGRYDGINAEEEGYSNFVNWVYTQYAPGDLNAQLRIGFNVGYKKSLFTLKPLVSYNILPFLTVGAAFIYSKDSGEAAIDSPYTTLALEPLIRVNFGSMYVAFVYGYNSTYTAEDRIKITNYANLRFVYTF